MDADTPRNRCEWGERLLRTTDYARLLLRRAQLALALLAVPVAMTVGVVVTGMAQPGPAATVSATAVDALHTTYDALSRIELRPGSLGAPARADEIARDLTTSAVDQPTVNGLLAGLSTLGCCWTLLGATGAIWRRRLDDRDLRDWAAGWARVEPRWSGRTV